MPEKAETFSIYLVTNMVTGKRYVGITTQKVQRRWMDHGVCGRKIGLPGAIKKYGRAAFSVEHIACCKDIHDLRTTETLLIEQENTLAPRGYNLTSGGEGMYKPSPEVRARMSEIMRGTKRAAGKRSPEAIANITKGLRGRKIPPVREETKAKMSAMFKGRTFWQWTDETKAKVSAALKGRKFSDDHRAKLRQSATGRKMAPEAVAKIWQTRRANMEARNAL